MSLEANSFEFGEFVLDTKEKLLLRSGKPVPITPKAFQLLLVLVTNHGHLVEKSELMNSIWSDSIVEESNLTYTMRLLRKALSDERQHPRFIETVPKAGYRFIADVRVSSSRNGSNSVTVQANADLLKAKSTSSGFKSLFVAGIVVLAVGIAFSGYWIASKAFGKPAAPVLSASFASEKLTTNGKVLHAVVSPDGKNVFYTNGIEGQQSVWLRQLESSHSVEIIPPSDAFYFGLALSPDGNFLYFARSPRGRKEMGVYRVSIFGGVPTKVVSGNEGWMSISPDGSKISFVRCPYTKDEYCSLWVADAINGKNERKLTSRPEPIRIGDNKFSPDGKKVAFAVGQSQNQANEFGLAEIDVESSVERDLTTEKFFNIKSLAWLPNRTGLLITAARIPNRQFRIWELTIPAGTAQPLTSDSESYSRLSLNQEATLLISTQGKQDFQLFRLDADNISSRRVLADASRGTFTSTGTIVFASIMSGNDEIWSMSTNGTGQRQLTNDPADDAFPVVSADNKWIFFASNRTGSSQVWRMNADGSDQIQITFTDGGRPVFASRDGKWIYYHHGVDRTLWRASVNGGDGELVLDKRAIYYAFSPDGQQIGFAEPSGNNKILGIASLADVRVGRTVAVLDRESSTIDLAWTPDGKGLLYVVLAGSENNALMLQPIDGAAPITIADLGADVVNSFAVAPDGKSFAIVQGGWKHDAVLIRGLK